jgi:hypothetical protein
MESKIYLVAVEALALLITRQQVMPLVFRRTIKTVYTVHLVNRSNHGRHSTNPFWR